MRLEEVDRFGDPPYSLGERDANPSRVQLRSQGHRVDRGLMIDSRRSEHHGAIVRRAVSVGFARRNPVASDEVEKRLGSERFGGFDSATGVGLGPGRAGFDV